MNPKSLLPKILFVLTFVCTQINAQSFQWARSAQGILNDDSFSTATDKNGNVFITGSFQGVSILFGTQTLTNADVSGATSDFYVAKYNSAGNLLWAQSAGGSANDIGRGVVADTSGNVYVTGGFNSASITFGTNTLSNSGLADIFVVKYDANGNVVWANKYGGASIDIGTSITSTNTGVFITGSFASSTLAVGSTNLSAFGGSYVFTAGFDLGGNVLWAKQSQGTGNAYGISNDGSGGVYITGTFSGNASIIFSGTTLNNTDGVGNNYDIFMVRYNAANGNLVWAKRAGAVKDDVSNSIKATSTGFFITGYFLGPTVVLGTTTLTNPDATGFSAEIFVAKYDLNGNNLWAKQAIGTGFTEQGKGVTTDASGNSYITGYSTGNRTIFGADTVWGAANNDIFLVKYDPSGTVLFAKNIPGTYNGDYGYSVATDAPGNVYVTGFFASDTLFCGNDTLINSATTNKKEIFLAKYGFSPTVAAFAMNFDTICVNNCIDFTDQSTNSPTSWAWTFQGGNPASSTSQSPTNICFNTAGTHTITLIAANAGGSDTTTQTVFIQTCAGIQEEKNIPAITIFPNPFSSETTLQINNNLKTVSLTIYNSIGQQVRQLLNISGQTINFQRDNLPAGLYFVRVTEGNKVIAVKKLLVADK